VIEILKGLIMAHKKTDYSRKIRKASNKASRRAAKQAISLN
jgi:hypothetical protein